MASRKFLTAKPQIIECLKSVDQDIFKRSEISRVFDAHRDEWALPKSMTGPIFAKSLVEAKIMREHRFPFPQRAELRYAKPSVPMLEVLQSIKANSYYTHATAMQVHRLVDQPASDIFINFEQPDHQRNDLPEQSRIDAAFKCHPRMSNNIIEEDHGRITMLNGMHTELLGVEARWVDSLGSEAANVRVTNLERTLIDITVRPYYAGGVEAVIRAFYLARGRTNVKQLVKYIHSLDFVYPYSQAIGWYMDRAGYEGKALKPLRTQPKRRRFYLDHKISKMSFDDKWQIFVPAHLAHA